MTEFLLGYVSGIVSSIAICVVVLMVFAGFKSHIISTRNENESESQDDIRLTKINSTYVRTNRHD